jgi:ubiquinol-cytochrome c reductase cytochrome b subunit
MPARATTIGKIGSAALGVALISCAIGAQVAAQESKPAASPTPATDDGAQKRIAHGRELFSNYSCGSCHTLADGGGEGHVGPALDGNGNLTEALIADRVNNGSGPMPAFGGQLSKEEVADLAYYVTQVAKKP